jgi:hypothetical protein
MAPWIQSPSWGRINNLLSLLLCSSPRLSSSLLDSPRLPLISSPRLSSSILSSPLLSLPGSSPLSAPLLSPRLSSSRLSPLSDLCAFCFMIPHLLTLSTLTFESLTIQPSTSSSLLSSPLLFSSLLSSPLSLLSSPVLFSPLLSSSLLSLTGPHVFWLVLWGGGSPVRPSPRTGRKRTKSNEKRPNPTLSSGPPSPVRPPLKACQCYCVLCTARCV